MIVKSLEISLLFNRSLEHQLYSWPSQQYLRKASANKRPSWADLRNSYPEDLAETTQSCPELDYAPRAAVIVSPANGNYYLRSHTSGYCNELVAALRSGLTCGWCEA